MGCCNKKVKIPNSQREVIRAVRNSTSTKSNRSPAGAIARMCPNCYTKVITKVCPICKTDLTK